MQVLTQLFDPIMVFRRLVGLGRELVQNLLNLIGQPMRLFDFYSVSQFLVVQPDLCIRDNTGTYKSAQLVN